jgi:hypothetical protein
MSTIATRVSKISVWQAVVIIMVLAQTVTLIALWEKYQGLKRQVPYSFHERIYVDQAIDAFAQKHHLSKEVVMQGRFPVVARTRDGLCVNIRGSAGGIGHVPIYCFDKAGTLAFHEER